MPRLTGSPYFDITSRPVGYGKLGPGFESGIVAKISRYMVLLVGPAIFGMAGCASFTGELRQTAQVAPPPPNRGVVFVADGAGDFRATSTALKRVLPEENIPLQVRTIRWSHGYWRVMADQIDEAHARAEGWRLAEQIRSERLAHPDEEIYLLAHCAGCSVVLAAAEMLPPQTVDKIILMAASVPTNYDLRPALRSSREGIDAFYSRRDRWCLGLWLRLEVMVGVKYAPVAGRFGFQPVVESPEDAACYARLRQHPWQPEWEWAGNSGGHYGCYQPEFLRQFVLPLLSHKPRN
jgi:hypothetical protein